MALASHRFVQNCKDPLAEETTQQVRPPRLWKIAKATACTLTQAGWKWPGGNWLCLGAVMDKSATSRDLGSTIKTVPQACCAG